MSLASHFFPQSTKYHVMIFILGLKAWLQNCVSPTWSSGIRAAGRLSLIGEVSEHTALGRNSTSENICNSPKKIIVFYLIFPMNYSTVVFFFLC